ncbi:HPr(Ser) kinase/phosphatase [Lactococcus termiticola]|uniref:HPr kinase/phosphorylase n=1 Tax=Lactococcus termiticola TaxID=2169526 RepID=A0A2R5HDN8_9LACT|nr:HPr(Ser) kinase/phosphatase [Lactococcus termiticola]GBG96187.1 HPr kinase/phosphorylase [Lactococcus termiticola]
MPVTVADLMKKITFTPIYITETALKKEISTSDILRPGLEMSGYFDYFQPERIQLFGMKEWSYAMNVVGDERYDLFKAIMTEVTPVIIVARGLEVPDEMVAAAKRQDVAILQSREGTSRLSSIITTYLDEELAERFTIHGVLMDIYGVGVLIQGASGIGKSETALDLVGRGHRLVADDRVDVYQRDAFTLAGEPAEVLRNMLELRGVGIIDVMNLYGARAVKSSSDVTLAIYLEPFDTEKEFDRLGNGIHHVSFAEVEVPQITIPVKTGRNVASIIEAAVMNFRAKAMGYDATQTFEDRLTALIEQNESEKN